MEEESECPGCPDGIPEWVMTFADLMSLLMVFFVLLLSFSEMDVQKYKQVAGSLKMAFGVQRDIKAADIPKGTSIVAEEFSPARPEPTVINEVRQQTQDELKAELKTVDPAAQDAKEKEKELEEALKKEILEGFLEIRTIDDQVVIRIRDKGSFDSASARVKPAFDQILMKISEALNGIEGRIVVAGHTDNVPIQTYEYPSNWILSAARAAIVAHTMIDRGGIDPARVEIRAYADNHPLETNDTDEGRAKNRRVEIIVLGERSTQMQLEQAIPDGIETDSQPSTP